MWLNFYIVLFANNHCFILKANVFLLFFVPFPKERIGILKVRYLKSKTLKKKSCGIRKLYLTLQCLLIAENNFNLIYFIVPHL